MIDHAIFKSFGLSDKEIIIYLHTLSHVDSGASDIEKATGIGRTYVYDLAQKLIEKRFLTKITKGKKIVFNAIEPKRVLTDQKKLIAQFEESVDELEKLQKKNADKPKIVYYAGKKELDVMQENFISSNISDEAIAFSGDSFYVKNDGYHQKKEVGKRLKEKVHFRAIAGVSDAVLRSQKNDERENRETRVLPKDLFDIKTILGVHGSKTIVVNHEKEFGFVVEDKDLADTITQIFDVVWESGKIIV